MFLCAIPLCKNSVDSKAEICDVCAERYQNTFVLCRTRILELKQDAVIEAAHFIDPEVRDTYARSYMDGTLLTPQLQIA